MTFPDSAREVYGTNPLEQVICQIRYPPILAISTGSPDRFQDAIREMYPWYEEKTKSIPDLPSGLPTEVAELLTSAPFNIKTQPPEHRFLTESKSRTISLTQGFVAVSESQYNRWEDFRKEVVFAETTLRKSYVPAFYNRVGLRYINVLVRSSFGLPTTPWSRLLNASLIGMLGDYDLADDVQELKVESLLRVPDVDQGRVLLRHGLAKTRTDGEQAYLIDADFHTNRRSGPNDVFEDLDRFNKWGGRLFRWATTGQLRDALRPTRI